MSTLPELEVFPNPNKARDYSIDIEVPEFTCICPKTGQPDFAILKLSYIPDAMCLELKALKLYCTAYRNQGAYHEAVTNQILDDFVNAAQPRYMRLRAEFYPRGGIYTNIEADYRQVNWTPQPVTSLSGQSDF